MSHLKTDFAMERVAAFDREWRRCEHLLSARLDRESFMVDQLQRCPAFKEITT